MPQRVEYTWPSYAAQVGLWVGMVGGLLYFNPSPRPPPRARRGGERRASAYLYLIVAMLALLGFWLRVHTLDELPLIVDEIGFAARASDILHGQHVPIFAPGHNANPSIYSWLLAMAMGLFGQNTFAIRLTPLVFGTVSIPAVYLLGRVWWSERVGLVAAVFLATYPAHVYFSRMSLYNIVDPAFAMLALAAVGRALRTGCWRDYVLAGMMAAVAQYFYHGSRLLLVLMGVYVGLSAVSGQLSAKSLRREAEKQRSRGFRTGLLWIGMAFALMALPRFGPLLVGGLPVEGNREAIRLPADFFPDNTIRAVLAWVGQPDVSPFWLSDGPLLLFPALTLLLIGLIVSVRRWRDARYAALVCAVVLTTVFGGAIWTAAPLYVRYMTAAPAIALLVGVGIERLSPLSRQTFKRLAAEKPSPLKGLKTRWSARELVTFAVLTTICLQGAVVALQQHPAEARERITAGQWWVDEAARQATGLPGETSVVFIVPPEFEEIQRITLADYLAAYGTRRAVAVNSGQVELAQRQMDKLPEPIITLEPRILD